MMIAQFEQSLNLVQDKLFRPLDLQFARLISADCPCRFLAAACVSLSSSEGHVCLPLELLHPAALFHGQAQLLAEELWQIAKAPKETASWLAILTDWAALSSGQVATPLVLNYDRLYLHRFWYDEVLLADYFKQPAIFHLAEQQKIRHVLDTLFGHSAVNDQKVAAALALTSRFAVISGGPGTGKTTTVAKLLVALLEINPGRLRIEMAAPTGKAAARLTESLAQALQSLQLSESIRQCLPTEATTLHRLLGAQSGSRRLRYHADNPLHLDLLVVDEASMVDLAMMARLIEALPNKARVIFLGDRDQLASVEAGSVLADLFYCSEQGYSAARARQLKQLTGCEVVGNNQEQSAEVADHLSLLQRSYRFDQHSGIGQLAKAVNRGQSTKVVQILAAAHPDITAVSLDSALIWQQMLDEICDGYRALLLKVQHAEPVASILQTLSHYQVLCALRQGPTGVEGLNQSIEFQLRKKGMLSAVESTDHWYPGRPIMVTRNDNSLGLFNGDIGMALLDEERQLRVYFMMGDGSIKHIAPSRLPPHETVWAMTVHKSQGSEFTHTALVLPLHSTPLLSRELIYTAITRARSQLSLYYQPSVLQRAVQSRTHRRSGLAARLLHPAASD